MDGKKVLCLHGFGTSAEFMKFQMSSWIERYPKTSFIFMDGFTAFPATFTQDADIIKFHGSKKPVYSNFGELSTDGAYTRDAAEKFVIGDGRPEVLRVISLIKEHGGIDGLITFSQGSLIAQMLALQLEIGRFDSELSPQMKPYFAIFFCPLDGFACPITLKMPVFMVFGAFDETTKMGFMMLMRFLNSKSTYFEGGHKVPVATSRLLRLTDEFVNKATSEKSSYLSHTSTYLRL